MVKEVVSYEGESGLRAILVALENVRLMLATSSVEPEQAAGYLGCINIHLAQIAGVSGPLRDRLLACGGMLCPTCKGYVGFVSNLSGNCHLCGSKLFPLLAEPSSPEGEDETA